MNYLKDEFPSIRKVNYFTDGCAGQYKNKNNFINLRHHKVDFGVEAESNSCMDMGQQIITEDGQQRRSHAGLEKKVFHARLVLLLLHHHLGNVYIITGTDEENIAKVYP